MYKLRFALLFSVFMLVALSSAQAQKFPDHPEKKPDEAERNKGKVVLLHLGYGFQLPAGDFATRFGNTGTLNGGAEYVSANNFIFGADVHFLFGNQVKEDPLAILRTDSGYIIGNDRAVAEVQLRARGIYVGAHVGRLFAFGDGRQGIRLTLGAGQLQHWIRLQDDTRSVTQLTGDYRKGYDRLAGGFAMHQFLGYQFLGKGRGANFYIGLESNQGFTEGLRDWDFSSRQKLSDRRLDIRYGLKAVWTFPIYLGGADKIYY